MDEDIEGEIAELAEMMNDPEKYYDLQLLDDEDDDEQDDEDDEEEGEEGDDE
jgi:hypothetical protein